MTARTSYIVLAIILSLAAIAYFPGLHAKFYLDDISSIVTSGYVTNPNLSAVFDVFTLKRSVVDISFFLNNQISGLNSYHFRLVNVFIHLINAVLVFELVKRLCSLANRRNVNMAQETQRNTVLALIVAVVFLLHPIQTQAVTYIVQRYTSLMTLFLLLSLLSYVSAKIGRHSLLKYSLAFVFFCLAVLSKETAIASLTIFLFLEGVINNKGKVVSTVICTSIFALFILQFSHFIGWVDLTFIDKATKDDFRVARIEYFKAQQFTLSYYLYATLGFWQDNYLEYDDSVQSILRTYGWAGYLALHVSLVSIALYFRKKLPLFAFGILGFYGAHSIESSFIPIRDVIVEHRSYFPNIFLLIAIGSAFLHLSSKFISQRFYFAMPAAFIILCASLSWFTYERNKLWSEPVRFYQNELTNSPDHWRIKNALVVLYMQKGNERLARAMVMNLISKNQGLNYAPVLINGIILFEDSNSDLAQLFERQLFSDIKRLSAPNRASAYYFRGKRLFKTNRLKSAKVHFEQAIRQYDQNPAIYTALANTHIKLNDRLSALKTVKDGLAISPNDEKLNNLYKQLVES